MGVVGSEPYRLVLPNHRWLSQLELNFHRFMLTLSHCC